MAKSCCTGTSSQRTVSLHVAIANTRLVLFSSRDTRWKLADFGLCAVCNSLFYYDVMLLASVNTSACPGPSPIQSTFLHGYCTVHLNQSRPPPEYLLLARLNLSNSVNADGLSSGFRWSMSFIRVLTSSSALFESPLPAGARIVNRSDENVYF